MAKKINLPIEEIISEYEAGMTIYQIADKYGISSSTIQYRLKKNGVKLRPRGGKKRIDLPMEEIISEYESGLSTYQLGEKYGVDDSTIYKRLKENGVKLRSCGGKINLPMKEIISEYQSGLSALKLAEKYGVGDSTIYKRLEENGVKLRPRDSEIDLPMEEIISEYESGMSTAQLGEKYGVVKSTIGRKLKENGVKLRPSRRRERIDLPMEDIISYYESGMTLTQLGEKYGVSYKTIVARLRENGVKIRPRGGKKRIYLPMKEIISEYQSGLSALKLAEKYGVAFNTIYRRLKENGVEIRYRGENFTISYNRREKKND